VPKLSRAGCNGCEHVFADTLPAGPGGGKHLFVDRWLTRTDVRGV